MQYTEALIESEKEMFWKNCHKFLYWISVKLM